MQRINTIRSFFLSSMALVAFAGVAQASTVNLTNVASGPLLALTDTGVIPGTSIGGASPADDWYFHIAGAATVFAQTVGAGIANFGFNLLDSSNTLIAGVSGGTFLNLMAPIAPGSYHLHFNGTHGTYSGTLQFLAPVPLPAAAWLMVSGLAALGAFARRRREEGLAS